MCLCASQHVATSPANPRALPPSEGDVDPSTIPLARAIKHLSQALRSLHMLINNNPGVEDEMIGGARPYLPALIYLVEASEVPFRVLWVRVCARACCYLCSSAV